MAFFSLLKLPFLRNLMLLQLVLQLFIENTVSRDNIYSAIFITF